MPGTRQPLWGPGYFPVRMFLSYLETFPRCGGRQVETMVGIHHEFPVRRLGPIYSLEVRSSMHREQIASTPLTDENGAGALGSSRSHRRQGTRRRWRQGVEI